MLPLWCYLPVASGELFLRLRRCVSVPLAITQKGHEAAFIVSFVRELGMAIWIREMRSTLLGIASGNELDGNFLYNTP